MLNQYLTDTYQYLHDYSVIHLRYKKINQLLTNFLKT